MRSATELKRRYHSSSFRREFPVPDGRLGVDCGEQETVFSLWSPLACGVWVLLYADGEMPQYHSRIPMIRGPQGVWTLRLPGNLHGTYYLYEIDHDGAHVTTWDPWARACACNGMRSMAVDLRRTDPPGWACDRPPALAPETIICELHVREFSWQEAAGFPAPLRGTYRAFTVPDTTLHGDGIHPTGIRYLQELGVTHVQLMPIFDYGSVDERDPLAFNWGYDPLNYNIPEGSYASDPTHGEVRIRECKEMIQSLHRAGLRVIMDVVYNHTYSTDSCLNRTVPWYFYRLRPDGTCSDGSCCGNDLASEEPMCAAYILHSVLYWAEEYHIDGFRFDLMGLMDAALINRIQAELDRIYGPGEKQIYGEPWAPAPTAAAPGFVPADKAHMKQLSARIAMFCDNTRDAIKGHVFDHSAPGFVNGGTGFEHSILCGVRGWSKRPALLRAPSQQIVYLSSHDNLTLWDKLCCTVPDEAERIACSKLAAAIMLTCQGTPFFLLGEEAARTKNGLDNTYRDPISLNRLDWERTVTYESLVSYYRGLIALRKQCPGLCDKSESASGRIFHCWSRAGAVRFCVDNRSADGLAVWNTLFVAYNARPMPLTLKLPQGIWQLLVNSESADFRKVHFYCSDSVTVSPHSAVILGQ